MSASSRSPAEPDGRTEGVRPFWHPLAAGIGLGLVLLAAYLVTGHGLGASGAVTRVAAAIGAWLAPAATAANAYLGGYVSSGAPLLGWITWEVLGVLLGGLIGALWSGRFRAGAIERGSGAPKGRRLALAFAGGILVGFGARLARGCTSGLGLSGGAALGVGGFLFLAVFLLGGFAAMRLVRRSWT